MHPEFDLSGVAIKIWSFAKLGDRGPNALRQSFENAKLLASFGMTGTAIGVFASSFFHEGLLKIEGERRNSRIRSRVTT
jgi:hypothetical protein